MGSRVRRSTSARPRSDRSCKLERRSSGPSPSRSRSSSGCRTARATSSGMRSIGRSSGTASAGSRRPRSRPACGRPSTGTGRTSGGGARSGRARSETTTKSNIAASASPPRGVDGTARVAECREVGKADAPKLVPLFEAFYGQWVGEPVTSPAGQRRIDHATGSGTVVVAEAGRHDLGLPSWRRGEPPGTESFLLSSDEGGWHLEGDIVALLDRQPAHVRYRIACDPSWRTLSAEVSVDRVGVQRELHLTVQDGGRWWVEGEED